MPENKDDPEYRKAVEEEKKGGVFGENKGKWSDKQPPPYKGEYGKPKRD